MKFYQALQIMMTTIISSHLAHGKSTLEEAVGSGCRNHVAFIGRFMTEAGSTCGGCSMCEGSTVNSLFIPEAKDTCIECSQSNDTCNVFEVVASFEHAWTMKYTTLTSAMANTSTDPKKIVISASNDLASWEVMHSSEPKFSDRQQKIEVVFQNDKKYKHYSMKYVRSDDKLYVGKYGLVEAYTKSCVSDLHAGITGEFVSPYTPLAHEFTSATELKNAVKLWVSNQAQALKDFGHIKGWRTEKIDYMAYLFNNYDTFNDDVSSWDTSNVTEMSYMFNGAKEFDADLSKWDVSKVTNFSFFLTNAEVFNQDLSRWNTSSCNNMGFMLRYTYKFNQDLSGWNTANVTSFLAMFGGASKFNADISDWATSKVITMDGMFTGAEEFNQDLSSWDISKCTAMDKMFQNAIGFDQKLCWDVSHLDQELVPRMFCYSGGSIDSDCNSGGSIDPECD